MQSVFMLADDATGPPKNPSAGRGSKQAGRGAGRSSQREQKQSDSASKSSGKSTGPETRTCRGCFVKGHLYRNCPDNPDRTSAGDSKIMVAAGEDDAADDDVYDSTVFMIEDALVDDEDPETNSTVLFSITEVLLDNQAGRSLFKNRSLLKNVGSVKPFYIGGIDGGSRGLRISEEGDFEDLGRVGCESTAAANILSKARLLDAGNIVSYDQSKDVYYLQGHQRGYTFGRKILSNGRRSSHYACDMADTDQTFVTTVADNMRQYTKREVTQAKNARELIARLGYPSSQATIDMLDAGMSNCDVTKQDVRNADAIFGPCIPSLRGKTHKRASTPASAVITPRVTQVQQILTVDLFFIKKLPFLLGELVPLGLALCTPTKNRTAAVIAAGIRSFINTARSRDFDCVQLRTDGEGALAAMSEELAGLGIVLDIAGPGQHVPVIERKIQTIKERVRAHENSLPYVMTRLLLTMCVLFCVSRLNMQPSRMSVDRTSPLEQFTGRKIDAARDLRVQFGDYVQARIIETDNTPRSRTQGCIAALPTGNLTGSVKMWCLATNAVVTRDQFKILPMPDLVIAHITSLAEAQGYTRGNDPDIGPLETDRDDRDLQLAAPLPDMMAIEGRNGVVQLADNYAIAPAAGVYDDEAIQEPAPPIDESIGDLSLRMDDPTADDDTAPAAAEQLSAPMLAPIQTQYLPAQRHGRGVDSLQSLQKRVLFTTTEPVSTKIADKVDDSVFTISVTAALRDRRDEATPVIMAELKQMLDKHVWHGVHTRDLSKKQRSAIIRSSMFLKDKYLASGAFERFKARLVAGGNQQDKGLYEDLSSPTVATSSVLAIAAIAAMESRKVIAIDIGGAFLNADMAPTGVEVHMRLNRVMTSMLIQLDPSYEKYRESDDTVVVKLDKALYGCVEASLLWYNDLKSKLTADGFVENPYDRCVFNKIGRSGKQISIVLHVDDLMVTSESQDDLDIFGLYLKSVYPETRTTSGTVLDYVGMTFDFTTAGEVRVTMDKCIDDILTGCGVTTTKVTPGTSVLFDVRDALRATESEAKWFHTHVAKILYLAKRVKPECLTAVAFLSTRVTMSDIDDLAKLRRLLGYIRHTRTRGIVLRIGRTMIVKAFIDAAYGVHQESGKSHTGCAIVLGESGPIFAKSAKQKIVTKSSTEAELVGLSDTASQAIHLRHLIIAQGYDLGPAVVYQDNMSCMALIKRGGPGSERSRHINIRHFWLSEKVTQKEVVLQHLGTEDMFANILTKPVQGAQFERERLGLTNWTA
jgi:Reverse transcriptase (RNA-dependent DNA polymerase)